MGKIVAIVNQKGGVGKTTTAVNLTAGLGINGKKVLLVDIDPQGNTTSGFGIDKRQVLVSSYDLIMGNRPANEIIVKTKFKGVDVIPSSMNLAGAEIELTAIENRETRLKNALAAVREQYDYIMLDCPPSLGLITLNALLDQHLMYWLENECVTHSLAELLLGLSGESDDNIRAEGHVRYRLLQRCDGAIKHLSVITAAHPAKHG